MNLYKSALHVHYFWPIAFKFVTKIPCCMPLDKFVGQESDTIYPSFGGVTPKILFIGAPRSFEAYFTISSGSILLLRKMGSGW